ncbi:MAG: polysaccharide biosynthesis tyrosine autokinase [Clostridiales bacterium]|nr:polysaccharide biosynthesis tyrosine autokinase [Clostridiales bacterium]
MSEYRSRQSSLINVDCLMKDILKQWWVILLGAVAAALLTVSFLQFRYVPEYTTSTTFVIGKSGFSDNLIYENLSSAEMITNQYTQMAASNILQTSVCEELGLDSFDARVSVQTVSNSNLMVLTVTAGSPELAYRISRLVNEKTLDLMSYYINGVTIHEISAPEVPTDVSNRLNLRYYMKQGALIGAAILLILFAFLSISKDTIWNKRDVEEKLEAKLLGTIYHEKKYKTMKAAFRKKAKSLLITEPIMSFRYVESFRLLASRIGLAMKKEDAKVLLVSSVSENEGKSTVAANLSLALAQEGKKVVLLDCDFRKPSQHLIFEAKNAKEYDFGRILKNKKNEKLILPPVEFMPNLCVGYTTKPRRKPWDKDTMKYLSNIIRVLRKYTDYIILDTAPMALVSDTEEYAEMADMSVLVVRQDLMEAGYINDAVEELKASGTKFLGCIFNNVHVGPIERMNFNGGLGSGYYGYSNYQHRESK